MTPMPSLDEVKQRIEQALPGARANVTDLTGGGDHLRAALRSLAGGDRSIPENEAAVWRTERRSRLELDRVARLGIVELRRMKAWVVRDMIMSGCKHVAS